MVRIFLIRHGEPAGAWGVVDDPGLTERGCAQAQAAAETIAGVGRVGLVSSPLQRCRDTAAPAAKLLHQHCGIDPKVAEVRTPAGLTDRRAWLQRTFAWKKDEAPVLWASVEPETRAWRDECLWVANAWAADIAVFTHFIFINAIVGAAIKSSQTVVCHPDHASIIELVREDGELKLIKLGVQMQTAASEAR
jgi:broad specificity phosphatase PhoE